MRNLQTFAGHELKKQDFAQLRKNIFENVLLSIATSNKTKKFFVTPEQYVVKYKARFGQVNHCLEELVCKNILKEPVEKVLDNGRMQKYYYFNKTAKQIDSIINNRNTPVT